MQINFNVPLLTLANEPFLSENGSPVILGKLLANSLVAGAKGEPYKFYDWAKKMYNGKVVDFDRADQDLIKKTIKDSDQLTVLIKAQLLELFDKKEEIKPVD